MTYWSFFNLSFLYQFQGPRNEEALEIFDKKSEINFETVHNIGKYWLHERFADFSVSIGEFHVKNFSFFANWIQRNKIAESQILKLDYK